MPSDITRRTVPIINSIDAHAAIYAYNRSHGAWPTADGEPGDIAWAKLVKEYLPYMPHTNDECNWQVSGEPEGKVCVPPEKMC